MAEINKTQRAKAIGIEPTTFSNVYNYGIIPKTPTLIKIADYFNVSLDYLFGRTDNPKINTEMKNGRDNLSYK